MESEMSMSPLQAKSEAMRLVHEGKSYAAIAEHLKAKGYASSRTGKPLSEGGVNQMLLKNGVRRRGKNKNKAPAKEARPYVAAQSRKTAAKATGKVDERLYAVKSILSVMAIDPSERIALAMLLIG